MTLTGDVPGDTSADDVTGKVTAALPGVAVDNQLKPSKEQVQAEIDEYLAANPITFRPDSAQLTAEGTAIVEHVAGLLAQTPDARNYGWRVTYSRRPSIRRARRTSRS